MSSIQTWENRIGGILSLLILTPWLSTLSQERGIATNQNNLDIEASPVERGKEVPTSFAEVIQRAAPSVVTINSTKTSRSRMNQQLLDPFFRRFFGDDFGSPQPRRQQGLGSGVIVSKDGYILTNNHVVEGADEIQVVMEDGRREFTATVVGTDPATDLAVLKVNADNLHNITLADSDKVRVGDIVLAIGNPFAVGQTVTMGIVSAVGRSGMGIVDYENFIQTDASINPGNSGGALIDAQGRLIGINTAILSRSGGNQGIGFAIPTTMARMVMNQIREHGKVSRGYLGVTIQPLTPDLAKEFGVDNQNGALIGGVNPDTPAAQAGLRAGDVIVEFNGKPVGDARQLRLAVSQTAPNTKVTLKVIRNGKPQTVNMSLGELPQTEVAMQGEERNGGSPSPSILQGMQVQSLTSNLRQQFEIPQEVRGVIVTQVAPASAAALAGIRPGDVIQEVGRKPVNSPSDLRKLLGSQKGSLLLQVWSQGGSRYVVLKPADNDPE